MTPTIHTIDDQTINPTVHAMWNNNNKKPFSSDKPRQDRKKSNLDASLRCSVCNQIGHDTTSDDGCLVFAKWTLCQAASKRLSEDEIRNNTKNL